MARAECAQAPRADRYGKGHLPSVLDVRRAQTRQVQHVRWEPAAGRLQHFFDDDLVCASVGVHEALLRGIEPFPTKELMPYDPGYVAGWVVERYQIDLVS